MTYATRTMVKDRLGIPLSDATEDVTIDSKLTAADAEVDNVLGRYTTVPLTGTIPQIIKDAAADLAAALFREDRNPKDEMIVVWRTRAERNLTDYITRVHGPKPYTKATSYAHIEED